MEVWNMKLGTDVPDEWEELIKKAMEIEGWKKVSPYIRELIKNDLKSKGLLGTNEGKKRAGC